MKIILLALAAFGSVTAINLNGIPQCAVPCLKEAIPKVGCDLDDTACQCNSATQNKLISIVSPCLLKKCDADELNQAQEAAGAACAAYSASIVSTAVRTPTGLTDKPSYAATPQVTATPSSFFTTPGSNKTTTKTSKSSDETETTSATATDDSSGSTATSSSSQATSTDNAAAVVGPAVGALLAVFAAALAL